MALIDSRGEEITDDWHYLEPDDGAAIGPHIIVPLEAFTTMTTGASPPRPIGIFVRSDTAIERIVPLLDHIDLVTVEFPKFRDGRGFTIARTLRGKYAFLGDIRAIGNILPDQFAALLQCGFSSVITPSGHPLEQWKPASSSREDPGPKQLLQRLVNRRLTGQPSKHGDRS
jgi:uncharacterized protein (DUF934 family)